MPSLSDTLTTFCTITDFVWLPRYKVPKIYGQHKISERKGWAYFKPGVMWRAEQKGFIWLGTEKTLQQSDSKKYQLCTKENNGLQSHNVTGMVEDEDGYLQVLYKKNRV